MINEFLENLYDEIFFDEFYRELFPVGSFEEKGKKSEILRYFSERA